MPAEEGQPDDQPRVTGQVPPPAPTTGLEQILPGRPPLPHAEEKGAFFVYQRELAPGTRLEQYEIIRVLGSGGFGITYLAKDLFLNRNVVIKENFPSRYSYRDPLTGHIRPNNEHDLENYTWALKSFLSEAQTLAELNNPGIVRILSVFEVNGTAYFAMEHITGLSLDYLGEKLHSTGHRYTEDELKGLLTRLLRILDYLHSRHIYHRDIKPGNILLTEEGTPVLIDFGAARHALKLHAATVLTTQGYSSPENKNILDQANSMPGMLPALEQLSKAGYPIAQQALGKTLISPDCPGGSRPEEGVEWLYRSATGGCYEAMKELGILLMDIPSYFPRIPQQPPLASRDYAQAARFLRMAVQYRDQEALYLLSLMYSQGWGVPASPELSSLMMERLNGSSYSTDSLNPNAPIAAYWLPLPLTGEKNTILRFTIPGPFAPSQLKGVTLHNTSLKDAFSISKINILQHGRLILDIISPQEVLPGTSSAPIGISIPEGLLADTTLPLEVEILLTPGNSCGVVEMPPPVEKKNSGIEIN